MEPNFQALQFIGEVALGLVGFSAILIGLARVDDGGFSAPDLFRVKLLIYTGLGALFGSILPFVMFNPNSFDQSWLPLLVALFVYACFGPAYFMPQVRGLRKNGFKAIFPVPLIIFNVSIFTTNIIVSGLMVFYWKEMIVQLYSFCLLLFLIQCTSAFIRTVFYRSHH